MSLRISQQSRGSFKRLEYSSTNCLGGGLATYGERIRRAHKEWELAHDADLPWAQVARDCQRLLGRLVDPATVNRWKSDKQEPTVAEFRALGAVLETDPALLAFGNGDVERTYVKPHPLKPPKELDGRSKSHRRKGND